MEERAGEAANQRREERHPLVRFIWYKLIDDLDRRELPSAEEADWAREKNEGIAHSCDISMGGVGLTIAYPYPVGARVFIEIAAGSFNISAVGMVVYIRPKGEKQYRVGIQFLVVPPNDRVLLRKICDRGQTGP
jgi:hypothetical protein